MRDSMDGVSHFLWRFNFEIYKISNVERSGFGFHMIKRTEDRKKLYFVKLT